MFNLLLKVVGRFINLLSFVMSPLLSVIGMKSAYAEELTPKCNNNSSFKKEKNELKLFSGNANPKLAEEIAQELKIELGKITVNRFADGEVNVAVRENVRGKDVYILQPTCKPNVNDNFMELVLMISTMRRANAKCITAIIPYFGYARQDKKNQGRVPISAADVARMIEAIGVDRVVVVDLHSGQIQGFFGPQTPCDNLNGSITAIPYFKNIGLKNDETVIVSPDSGGVYRAKKFRENLRKSGLRASFAMLIKERSIYNVVDQTSLVGEVKDLDVIIIDDIIDTAGTLVKAGEELRKNGAKRIIAYATHGVFSGPAIERIKNSTFEKVVISNTVPVSKEMLEKCGNDKIVILSIAKLLASSILRIHEKKSVSDLFTI